MKTIQGHAYSQAMLPQAKNNQGYFTFRSKLSLFYSVILNHRTQLNKFKFELTFE